MQADPNHKYLLWESLPTSACMKSMGFMMTLGRWTNYESKHDAVREDRGVILMVLLYMGLLKKWWPKIEDSPFYGIMIDNLELLAEEGGDVCEELAAVAEAAAEVVFVAAAPAPEPGEKANVKDSNEELKRIRATRHNTLDFSCCFFADLFGLRELDAIYWTHLPFVEEFRKELTNHKTLWGHSDLFLKLSGELFGQFVDDVWAS